MPVLQEGDQVAMDAKTLRRDGLRGDYFCFVAEAVDGSGIAACKLPPDMTAHIFAFCSRFVHFVLLVSADALGFYTYSTWEGLACYLEDLYVQPAHRSKGVGNMLLRVFVQSARDKDCKRVQWQAIDWNSKAIDFYVNKVFARERTESGDAKWVNFIMDVAAQEKYLASQQMK